jgi:hypothetical protein
MKKYVITIIICSLLAACGGRMSKKQSLDHTLYQYEKVMRWAQYDNAMSYFSPDMDEDQQPSRLDIDRLRQFNISSYTASPILPGESEDTITQNVQIKFYNIHTKRERVVIDQQVWQYDEEAKRWWLMSGLPDLVHHQ